MEAIFNEHWDKIALIVIVVAQMINGYTPHWSRWPGRIGKILGLLTKVFALWGNDKTGTDKEGESVERKPYESTTRLIVFSLVLVGCGSWQATSHEVLDGIHIAAQQARKTGIPAWTSICVERAKECKSEGRRESECKAALDCLDAMDKFGDALTGTQVAFSMGKVALATAQDAGDAGGAREKVAAAISRATEMLLRAEGYMIKLFGGSQ